MEEEVRTYVRNEIRKYEEEQAYKNIGENFNKINFNKFGLVDATLLIGIVKVLSMILK